MTDEPAHASHANRVAFVASLRAMADAIESQPSSVPFSLDAPTMMGMDGHEAVAVYSGRAGCVEEIHDLVWATGERTGRKRLCVTLASPHRF